jgi:hypothetical protein
MDVAAAATVTAGCAALAVTLELGIKGLHWPWARGWGVLRLLL